MRINVDVGDPPDARPPGATESPRPDHSDNRTRWPARASRDGFHQRGNRSHRHGPATHRPTKTRRQTSLACATSLGKQDSPWCPDQIALSPRHSRSAFARPMPKQPDNRGRAKGSAPQLWPLGSGHTDRVATTPSPATSPSQSKRAAPAKDATRHKKTCGRCRTR